MDPADPPPTSCLNPGVPPIRSWEQLGDLVDGGWGKVVMFWGKGGSKFCSFFFGRGWEGRREVSSLDFQGELMKIYERSGVKAKRDSGWLGIYLLKTEGSDMTHVCN